MQKNFKTLTVEVTAFVYVVEEEHEHGLENVLILDGIGVFLFVRNSGPDRSEMAHSKNYMRHFEGIQRTGMQAILQIGVFHLQTGLLGQPVLVNGK